MKIGMNLLLWTGNVTSEQDGLLESIKATGFDGVEIPIFGGDVAEYQKLGGRLRKLGLAATAVTVMPGPEANPISGSKAERDAGLAHLKYAIDCCQAMGAEILCGPFYQPLGQFTGAGPTAEEKSRCVEVHQAAAEHAAKAHVKLAVEFLNRFECYFLTTMADAAEHVRRVDHPAFTSMFDTFHANIEEKDPVGALRQHASAVGHFHISENDRGTPGKGHIDFAPVIRTLREVGYEGWLTIEAFGRALPELAAATRVWRDFFPSPDEVYQEGFKLLHKLTKG